MPNMCAIICDIKGSRKLENWYSAIDKLGIILEKINKKFKSDVYMDFKPSIGDEFQGTLTSLKKAYDIYIYLKNELPIKFYCGIGSGDIEKLIEKDNSLRGTAFYRARDALEVCKKEKKDIFVKLSSEKVLTEKEEMINTFLLLIETIKNSMTKKQKQVINYYREHPNYNYDEIANYFKDISGKGSKQSVQQILKAARWKAIQTGEDFIKRTFDSI